MNFQFPSDPELAIVSVKFARKETETVHKLLINV